MRKKFNIQKALPISKKNTTYIIGIYSVIYILAIYAFGLYFGFYNSQTKFSLNTFTKFILPTTLFICISEFIREKILSGKLKYKSLIAFFIMVFLEFFVNINQYNKSELKGFLGLLGNLVFINIANNLLFNYVSIRYGKVPNIIYRLVISLYKYIIPIIPDIHLLIQILIKLIMPYLIYITLEYTNSKKQKIETKQQITRNRIINTIVILIMLIVTILVSCQFKYGILVIGSGSMTGYIDKGDMIIFEQYKNQKLQKGQVLVFKDGNRIIIHRIVDINNINGEKRYYTKGDANKDMDDGYVTENNIIGIYKTKINKVGFLTLYFNNIFEK